MSRLKFRNSKKSIFKNPLKNDSSVDLDELPMKLPPKQDLGMVYKKVANGHVIPLTAAIVLAIVTPILTMTLRQRTPENRSFASVSPIPVIKYMVIEDAETDLPYMIADTPTLELSKSELPERINIRPEMSGSVSRVVFNLPDGQEIVDSSEPFTFAGDNGWEPLPGTETISVTAYGTGAQSVNASNVYTFTLTITE